MIMRRVIRAAVRLARLSAVAVALIAIAGVVYEQIGTRTDRRRFQRIGRSIDVGGRTLNLHCSGGAAPTVILESDHGVPGLAWSVVQSRISKLARACWYDRAGYGWSDSGPFPRHSNEIAQDLHMLLRNAGVVPPYVLVGHRFGAFNTRAFRASYPDEVVGMVLIDPPSDDPAADNPTVPPKQHIEFFRTAMVVLFRTLGEVGFWRLMSSNPAPPSTGFSPGDWAAISMLTRQPKSVAARLKETPLRVSAAQVRAAGDLGDVPLIVLSPPLAAAANTRQRRKFELQSGLVRLSRQGTLAMLPGSDPMLPYTAPDSIIQAIGRIVAETRRTS
jgi:pimeloyl-ACP methyl ester carboxylesterase